MESIRPLALVISVLFAFAATGQVKDGVRVINGVPVPDGYFREAAKVITNGSACTGVLVGPRVVMTAAHCVNNGAISRVQFLGVEASGKAIRHTDYPGKDVDVAVIVLDKEVAGVHPASVSGSVSIGDDVFFLGYGCTNPGGSGGNDGVLRIGASQVSGHQNFDFISKREDGAALCFGDSGGPTLLKEEGEYRVVGVNSKGNIKDTNYSLNLADPLVQSFLREVSTSNKLEICGLTSDCEEPVVGPPQFKKDVYEYSLYQGQAFTVILSGLLAVTADMSWTLDANAPEWISLTYEKLLDIRVPKDAEGEYEVSVTARNSEGVDAALIRIRVQTPIPAPTCEIQATPGFVEIGQTIAVTMKTKGKVQEMELDGKPYTQSLQIKGVTSGVFVLKGRVKGPGGESGCLTRYVVK